MKSRTEILVPITPLRLVPIQRYRQLTMLHQWFTCVHLLDTYLTNLTEGFQLSFTTHLFPSEQHKVVCNQHLHAECGGSATISLEVTTEIYQIWPISDFILSQDTLYHAKVFFSLYVSSISIIYKLYRLVSQ